MQEWDDAVETIDPEDSPPGLATNFWCRRCDRNILSGEVAHLVDRRIGEAVDLPMLHTSLIVCGECLLPDDDQYQETASRLPVPVRLTPGERDLLRSVADGRVYRRPKRAHVMEGDEPCSRDKQVNKLCYALVHARLAQWVPPSAAHPVGTTPPTAWAVATEEGIAYLLREEQRELDRLATLNGSYAAEES